MRAARGRKITCCLLAALVVCAGGCASFRLPLPNVEDVAPARKKRTEEAIRQFEAKRDQARFEAAQSRWREGDYDACEAALAEIIERNKQHVPARLTLAELYLFRNEPKRALVPLEQVLELEPHNAAAHHALAIVLEQLGQQTGALAHYQRAAEAEPGNEVFRLSYQAAWDARGDRGGDSETPSIPADQAARPASYLSDELSATSHTFVPQAEDPPPDPSPAPMPSAPHWASGAAVSPAARDWLTKAEHVLRSGAASSAKTLLGRAMQCEADNPQIPIVAATLSLKYHQAELAVALLVDATGRFPDAAAIYRLLGVAYYRSGDLASSEVALRQALSLDSADGLTYFLLGSTVAKLGRRDEAEQLYLHAQRMDPSLPVRR